MNSKNLTSLPMQPEDALQHVVTNLHFPLEISGKLDPLNDQFKVVISIETTTNPPREVFRLIQLFPLPEEINNYEKTNHSQTNQSE